GYDRRAVCGPREGQLADPLGFAHAVVVLTAPEQLEPVALRGDVVGHADDDVDLTGAALHRHDREARVGGTVIGLGAGQHPVEGGLLGRVGAYDDQGRFVGVPDELGVGPGPAQLPTAPVLRERVGCPTP